MRILVQRDGKTVATINGIKCVADHLGITVEQVEIALRSGTEVEGVTLDYICPEDPHHDGGPVLAYTSTGVTRFKSMRECAKVYEISRNKLLALIESGATHTDGKTTFDIPCI